MNDARALIGKSLGLPETDIDAATTLETCPAWDSLAHFRLVLALEENLGRTLTPMETVEITSFNSVENLLAAQR